MNKRIRELRKAIGLNQTEFGKRIGVKQSAITGYETGIRTPLDSVILSICREFGVSEEWLRTGNGEMFLPAEDEVAEQVSHLLDESNPFYDLILAIMKSYDQLDDAGQKMVHELSENIINNIKKKED